MTKPQAEKRPAGYGRSAPNENPEIDEPMYVTYGFIECFTKLLYNVVTRFDLQQYVVTRCNFQSSVHRDAGDRRESENSKVHVEIAKQAQTHSRWHPATYRSRLLLHRL